MFHYKNREEQPKIFRQSPLIYPVTLQELPNGRDSSVNNWTPVPMLDLRRFKEAIVSCGMHSLFVKQISNLWSVCNRIIPNNQIELVKLF